METLLKDISKRIKKYRLKCGYTQQELAEKSDLSLPFINLIENNHRKITLETLIKILNALDVSLSTFFLPYSHEEDNTVDAELTSMIIKIQQSQNKEKFIHIMNEIIDMTDSENY